MSVSLADFIVLESGGSEEDRFFVARLATPSAPLVSRVAVYALMHAEPIAYVRAESAVIDLNRGGDGRGPGRLPAQAAPDDEDDELSPPTS